MKSILWTHTAPPDRKGPFPVRRDSCAASSPSGLAVGPLSVSSSYPCGALLKEGDVTLKRVS